MGPINNVFKRRGIRVHDPSAPSIGARTPSEQMSDAAQQAIRNDPVLDGALPQNRIGRYTDINSVDQT